MKNWIQQMLLWRKKTDKGRMTLGKVQKEYRENDVCMGELLDALPADGLSIEEAFELAITAKNGRTETVSTGVSTMENRKNCKVNNNKQ